MAVVEYLAIVLTFMILDSCLGVMVYRLWKDHRRG